MRKIVCEVSDEYLLGAGTVIGAAGSYNDVALELHFSEMWDGTTKHITWLDARGGNPTIVVLTAQMLADGNPRVYLVPVPSEAKAYEGKAHMSVKGATDDKTTLSVAAEFVVMPSVYDPDAEEAAQPTPTVAEQLQAEIDNILDEVSGASEAAAAAAQSASEAAGSAEAVQDAKTQWENMSAQATSISAGTPATASYSNGVLSLGIPMADGLPPISGANEGDFIRLINGQPAWANIPTYDGGSY